jgi:uncharacterized protein YcnI
MKKVNRAVKSTVRGFLGSAIALTLFVPVAAWGHITVLPRESTAGIEEKYIVRAPTEGQLTSKMVVLEVPEGVTIAAVAVPQGWKQEVKKEGNRIVGITWMMDVEPGQVVEFWFMARNPRDKEQVVWKIKQHFSDGSVQDMTNGANGVRPSVVTKLAPIKRAQ